jgi:hypothetical protein
VEVAAAELLECAELGLGRLLAAEDCFDRVTKVVCEGDGTTWLDHGICVAEEIETWTLVEGNVDNPWVDGPNVVTPMDTECVGDASHVRVGVGMGQMVVVPVITTVLVA